MAKKVKSFIVAARLNIECDTEIKAESLEDAIAQARKLSECDFVTIHGDYMDGDMDVTGVFEGQK